MVPFRNRSRGRRCSRRFDLQERRVDAAKRGHPASFGLHTGRRSHLEQESRVMTTTINSVSLRSPSCMVPCNDLSGEDDLLYHAAAFIMRSATGP